MRVRDALSLIFLSLFFRIAASWNKSLSLPSLSKLTVERSPGFQGLWNFPSLKYLNTSASGLVLFHTSLQRLEISHCEQLQHVPEDWPPCKLTHFSARHCPQLCKWPWGIECLQALEDMEIFACG